MNILIKHYINSLKKEILKQENVKEYLFFKSKLDEKDIKRLKSSIKLAKKQLVKDAVINANYEESKEGYIKLNEEYSSNPYYENYIFLKDEVYNDLYVIKDLIEG